MKLSEALRLLQFLLLGIFVGIQWSELYNPDHDYIFIILSILFGLMYSFSKKSKKENNIIHNN